MRQVYITSYLDQAYPAIYAPGENIYPTTVLVRGDHCHAMQGFGPMWVVLHCITGMRGLLR